MLFYKTMPFVARKKSTLVKNKELQLKIQLKMNKIINKFSLTGDKSMPELD